MWEPYSSPLLARKKCVIKWAKMNPPAALANWQPPTRATSLFNIRLVSEDERYIRIHRAAFRLSSDVSGPSWPKFSYQSTPSDYIRENLLSDEAESPFSHFSAKRVILTRKSHIHRFHQTSYTVTMSSHHCVVVHEQPDKKHKDLPNRGARGISYFTPAQKPPAGTASDPQPDGSHPPKLFQPLKIRGMKLQNRIMVSLTL